ncbi:MAG TPA: PQQ-binding-like beta-propeller repeat protein [Rhizomicrobium sp.]
MKHLLCATAAAVIISCSAVFAAATDESVDTYHNSMDRHGDYTVPSLSFAAAANVHPDKNFHANVKGHVYAQPLFWKPAGAHHGRLIVATESNVVYALDGKSGAEVWHTPLAGPVALKSLPCGNIDPSGITGTPVIDPASGTIYLDALTAAAKGPRHMIYALSAATGAVLPHWPIDVQQSLAKAGAQFSSSTEGERSALQFLNGTLYVNYGGNFGDCGTYFGTVIQIDPTKAKIVANWQTRAKGGGIWAQGGMASDGSALFVTTGNTMGASTWSDGETIVRLEPGLAHSSDPKSYFAPANWKKLDDQDLDLGGTEAIPIEIGNGPAPAKRVIAFGKDGNAYLVNRANLGGVGGAIAREKVSTSRILTAPAVHQTKSETKIAFSSLGSDQCPQRNITVLNIADAGKSSIGFAWCKPLNGAGAPIVTTTDGTSDAIVWVVGAEGDNELHGFDAHNGHVVFSGNGTAMTGLHHFQTILVTKHRFYVAGDGKVYAFTFSAD